MDFGDFDVRDIAGPMEYGLLMGWALIGILVHQVYIYNTRVGSKDALFYRILANGVLAIDIVFMSILTHYVHWTLIEGWGNPMVFIQQPWSSRALALSTTTTATIVHWFVLWRVWQLNSGNMIIRICAAVVTIVPVVHFSCAAALTSLYKDLSDITRLGSVRTLISIDVAAALMGDILVAALMTITLLRLRNKTPLIKSTAQKIHTLLFRGLETGYLTILATLMALILLKHPALSKTAYYITCNFIVGRLYSIMLLANLNGRSHFSGAVDIVGNVHPAQAESFDVDLNGRTTGTGRRQGLGTNTHPRSASRMGLGADSRLGTDSSSQELKLDSELVKQPSLGGPL